jgi:septal ring factor EnvC (AmiA/AmiB activator)
MGVDIVRFDAEKFKAREAGTKLGEGLEEMDTSIDELTKTLRETAAVVERVTADNTRLTVELQRAEDAKKAHKEELEHAKFVTVTPEEVIKIREAHEQVR